MGISTIWHIFFVQRSFSGGVTGDSEARDPCCLDTKARAGKRCKKQVLDPGHLSLPQYSRLMWGFDTWEGPLFPDSHLLATLSSQSSHQGNMRCAEISWLVLRDLCWVDLSVHYYHTRMTQINLRDSCVQKPTANSSFGTPHASTFIDSSLPKVPQFSMALLKSLKSNITSKSGGPWWEYELRRTTCHELSSTIHRIHRLLGCLDSRPDDLD